uniref:Uncharacterized protein n=1 Tax=Arundo donax TaxID=35708 RepID=A0A0A8Z6F8_ARUDO
MLNPAMSAQIRCPWLLLKPDRR